MKNVSVCLFFVLFIVTTAKSFTNWTQFTVPLPIPRIIDMRNGGHLDMKTAAFYHNFGSGINQVTKMYGYGELNGDVTFPGPTILVSRDVPISITWHNEIEAPHILASHVEPSLMMSSCYPGNCFMR